MNNYSPEEAKRIALSYFLNETAKCLRDGTSLNVKHNRVMGSSVWELEFKCDKCGSYGSYKPIPAPKEDNWTEDQQKRILNQYWATGNAICLNDNARLICQELGETGPARILINCPLCGRNLDSINLEN